MSLEVSSGASTVQTLVSDTDSGIKGTLSKFTDNTKFCGAVNMLEGSNTIQRELDRLMKPCEVQQSKAQGPAPGTFPGTPTGWADKWLRATLKRKSW